MENLQNQKSNEELVAIPEKYMLTIREAASYFNIGIKNMRRLCESNEGKFSVRWGNKYLICRPREPRNYEFATIQRLMIVGKGQNTWRYSSFEGESCIERDILLNLIVERGKRFAYPFNDMCWIVKRYRGGGAVK